MRFAVLITGVLMASTAFGADSRSIEFDQHTEFREIRTFAIRQARATTSRPELNNALFLKDVAGVIRANLQAKGLIETSERPDVLVDYTVGAESISTTGGQRATRTPDGPGGMRGQVIPGTGPVPVRFVEGQLVLDLYLARTGAMAWRGVYRTEQSTGSKLAQKLPDGAKKLLSQYPPKKKK